MFEINLFRGKKVLVGITGGIAAYKTTELVRYLVKQGAEVQVVMTAAAQKFISRLTMETLSQNPVLSDLFPEKAFSGTLHIHTADMADVAIIAPASYNFIGKICSGIADDLLTTITAALHCPMIVAPAMNVHMWNNPILQNNLSFLEKQGILVCPPEAGFLAEGYSGMGRLAPLDFQIQYLYQAIHPNKDSLKNKKVLITAGRTEEPLDPVRIFTNQSTGKMGYALAWEALARGAKVTLIHGPNNLSDPVNTHSIGINNAQQMFEKVKHFFSKTDLYLSAAAIADYRPTKEQSHKIKKTEKTFTLKLERNPDILKFVGEKRNNNQLLVGFAVETESTEKNALQKLQDKNLDMIVLNNPLEEGAGFRHDTNKVVLFHKNGNKLYLPLLPKIDVAREILTFLINNKESVE